MIGLPASSQDAAESVPDRPSSSRVRALSHDCRLSMTADPRDTAPRRFAPRQKRYRDLQEVSGGSEKELSHDGLLSGCPGVISQDNVQPDDDDPLIVDTIIVEMGEAPIPAFAHCI